jgi:TPR repeat protein
MSRAINLDAATIVTQLSKRTLWRRLSDGQITRQADDAEGRTMLTFEDIIPMLCVPLAQEDYELLIEAATGNAERQNDLALVFLDAEKPDIGLYWLKMAANQGHPDAMHNLSKLYIKGIGTQKDDRTGLMWLAKAASLGHVIADQQITALTRARKA